jgi:hypothetical protein
MKRIPTVFPTRENFPRGIEIHPILENAHCQHYNSVILIGLPFKNLKDQDMLQKAGNHIYNSHGGRRGEDACELLNMIPQL